MRQITIFASNFRPLEDHSYGLIYASYFDKDFTLNFVIDKSSFLFKKINNDYPSYLENINFISKQNLVKIFFSCLRSKLIFGKPNFISNILLLITQLLNRKSIRVVLIPGNVLKAVGDFKKKKNHFLPLMRKFIMNKFFKIRILTPTPEVKLYLSAAFSYPINTLIDYPLPKHLFLNIKLNSDDDNKNIILFSPTHRWGNLLSPLENLLLDDVFIDSLVEKGIQVKYTIHPHYSLAKPLSSKVSRFKGEWGSVFSLVTDYSSIGYDYYYSGGQNLIYYTPDIIKFEKHEGKGPLFESHLKSHYNFINKNDLLKKLLNLDKNISSRRKHPSVSNKIKKNYFKKLINYIENA